MIRSGHAKYKRGEGRGTNLRGNNIASPLGGIHDRYERLAVRQRLAVRELVAVVFAFAVIVRLRRVVCQARDLERAHAPAIEREVLVANGQTDRVQVSACKTNERGGRGVTNLQFRLDCCTPPLHIELQRALDAFLVLDVCHRYLIIAAASLLEREHRARLILVG